jgi:hypothetical protein
MASEKGRGREEGVVLRVRANPDDVGDAQSKPGFGRRSVNGARLGRRGANRCTCGLRQKQVGIAQ